eukprot:2807892-Pleurochrysis_carterae.AAC.4
MPPQLRSGYPAERRAPWQGSPSALPPSKGGCSGAVARLRHRRTRARRDRSVRTKLVKKLFAQPLRTQRLSSQAHLDRDESP